MIRALSFLWLSLGAYAQTVYLAGDSTMALGGGGSGTQGWGVPLTQFLTLRVVNDAVGGESARSFSSEGKFASLISSVKAGDFVIIEFGHNDATSGSVDNGKQDAVGDGFNQGAISVAINKIDPMFGTQILIHSFAFYIENAVNSIKAKGAIPIISSVTPDNIWSENTIAPGGRFVTYAHSIGVDTNITYVDHYSYTAQAYNKIGQTALTAQFYPIDHLHTSTAGALVVAEAFIRGLLCGTSTLKNFVNAAGKAVPNGCL